MNELNFKTTEEQRADFWNSKWQKKKVVYRGQDNYLRDVRTFLEDKSDLLKEVLDEFNLVSVNGDSPETVYNIEQWVRKNIKYKPDVGEYWKEPEITLQDKYGDCEDHILLIKSLSLIAGVPDYLFKVVAGYVQDPFNKNKFIGHAYGIILDDEVWKVVDSTYFPTMIPINKRIEHKQDLRYNKGIWFTFNKEIGFSDKEIEIEGRLKKMSGANPKYHKLGGTSGKSPPEMI